MNIIDVNTKKILDELYDDSALTITGLDVACCQDFVDWVKEYTNFKSENNENVYVISGKVMNDNYGLTNLNRYPDDIHIVSIMLSDLNDYFPLVHARFEIGGRWFDDIVNNDLAREGSAISSII